jgi:hypothetical protein
MNAAVIGACGRGSSACGAIYGGWATLVHHRFDDFSKNRLSDYVTVAPRRHQAEKKVTQGKEET